MIVYLFKEDALRSSYSTEHSFEFKKLCEDISYYRQRVFLYHNKCYWEFYDNYHLHKINFKKIGQWGSLKNVFLKFKIKDIPINEITKEKVLINVVNENPEYLI